MLRSRGLSYRPGLDVSPWHEFIDAACGPAVDELCQHVREPDLWIDAVEFSGLDERRDDCPILSALIVTSEQTVLSI